MKKIIAAFDGLKYSVSTRDYAIEIAKKTNTHLVGVFMEDRTYTGFKIYELISSEGVDEDRLKQLEQQDKNARAEAVHDFEQKCSAAGIKFSIHRDRGIAIHELKHEAVYADLLIIDAKETLTHYSEKLPTRFIRDLLDDAPCPVLLVPAKFKPVSKFILLYDGSPSSVYAIKMFSYMFPELNALETEVLSVRTAHSPQEQPDARLMKEFTKDHFPSAGYVVLKGHAKEQIKQYLKTQNGHSMAVMGAYKRGSVSRWFKASMADVLMRGTKLPLFIAHK